MLVYQKKKGEAKVIDFRESAPANANKDMFHGDPKKGIRGTYLAMTGHFQELILLI